MYAHRGAIFQDLSELCRKTFHHNNCDRFPAMVSAAVASGTPGPPFERSSAVRGQKHAAAGRSASPWPAGRCPSLHYLSTRHDTDVIPGSRATIRVSCSGERRAVRMVRGEEGSTDGLERFVAIGTGISSRYGCAPKHLQQWPSRHPSPYRCRQIANHVK